MLSLLAIGCVGAAWPGPHPGAQSDPTGIAALAFSPTVDIDPSRPSAEPTIVAAPDGTIWITSLATSTIARTATDAATGGSPRAFALWSSKDGGASWTFASLPLACRDRSSAYQDTHVAVGPDGAIYFVENDYPTDVRVVTSHDGGASWSCALTMPDAIADRPWASADPFHPGTAYVAYDEIPQGMRVERTTDGGSTWTDARLAMPNDPYDVVSAPLVVTRDVVGFGAHDQQAVGPGRGPIQFFRSTDRGVTFARVLVGGDARPAVKTPLYPTAFATRDGAIYVAWFDTDDAGGSSLVYAFSRDAGATWSPRVVTLRESGDGLFLWGVGGSAGRIAFSWFATDGAGPVYEKAAIVLGADGPAPVVTIARVASAPAGPFPPCVDGPACTAPTRWADDFQSCAVAPDGTLLVAYPSWDGSAKSERGDALAVTLFARATRGPKLLDLGKEAGSP